ncbi:MAG: ribosome small subunit-dependent GTPase A [Chlamydiia bacterium]|nr:ribosome small subunit-dependent GTPase A [Chlamydiia bacterium]
MDYLEEEEAYFSKGKREGKKERRKKKKKDRSKYKKSDLERQQKQDKPISPDEKRGRILAISPERITLLCEGKTLICTLKGALKKEKTKEKNLIAVGDWVHVEVVDEETGAITYVEPRKSSLCRAENLRRRKTQLIAANVDQVFIVMSLVSPQFKPLLVDRYVLSAKVGNMAPIILVNKLDFLETPPDGHTLHEVAEEKLVLEEFLAAYTPLNIPVLTLSVVTGEGLGQLKTFMEGKTSVFSGQSGVGKSSLINAILDSNLPIGPIAHKTNKGSHTTTAAELIPLENGAFCIDTPGIKSFGLWENDPETILSIFPDFAPFAAHCKFHSCTHIHEPDCAVRKALEEGKLSPLRYTSYLTLLEDAPPKEWE